MDTIWPDLDNVYNDVEVIELDRSTRVQSVPKNQNQLSNLRSTEFTDPKIYQKTTTAATIPSFAPVAAAISSRWSTNQIDTKIASKQYDSDRSHSSTNSSVTKYLKASYKSYRDEAPQAKLHSDSESESESDFAPALSKIASPKRMSSSAELYNNSDLWEAKKEMNKFNSFLNNNKSTDFSNNRKTVEHSSFRRNNPLVSKNERDNIEGRIRSSSTAYMDFIRNSKDSINSRDETRAEKGDEEKNEEDENERREVNNFTRNTLSQPFEESRTIKDLGESPATSKEMIRRKSSSKGSEDDFIERPSRSSLSSTFPKSGSLTMKHQSDVDRLSKTSSSFNKEDTSEFIGLNEDDVIDPSASASFTPEDQPVSPSDAPSESSISIASKLFQSVQTKSEVRDSVKSTVHPVKVSQSSLSEEGRVSQTSRNQDNDNDNSDTDYPNDNLQAEARGLHFTIRDSEDRSGGSARAEPRVINRPDSTEEEDDDVLYGTMRFGESDTVSSSYDGAYKNKSDALLLKPKVLESPFGTMTAISANLKKEAKISASRTSSDVRNTSGRIGIEQSMNASYHPSESGNSNSNSIDFTLSQSSVPIDDINQGDKEKRHVRGEELLIDVETTKAESEPPSTDDAPSSLRWQSGRAPTELIETGRAFDVFVSALKLHDDSLLSVSGLNSVLNSTLQTLSNNAY